MTLEAYKYLISGRVQGVGFRWFTERKAHELGVRGFVRNLPDGRVEVHAQAEPSVLSELERLLRRGPATASVNELDREALPVDDSLTTFEVRHDGRMF